LPGTVQLNSTMLLRRWYSRSLTAGGNGRRGGRGGPFLPQPIQRRLQPASSSIKAASHLLWEQETFFIIGKINHKSTKGKKHETKIEFRVL
jgi:hypothetical protein